MIRRPLLLSLPLLAAAAPALAQAPARPTLGDVGQALMRDLQRAGEAAASEALAQWIWSSRADAVKAGVSPIPAAIRSRLKGHFPEALLARVRYRVGTGNEYSLQTHAFKGNAAAITLGDVILFRPAEKSADDPRLWAHELTHVQQYDRWGVRGFAQRYTLDHVSIEREAEAGAARYSASRGK
ncbi:MAG: DUF4157 domain-containing protein [Sphingomonadales bacterium]|nr:DUF4157 domain-containing protein [Sphingomonadales bacterium]